MDRQNPLARVLPFDIVELRQSDIDGLGAFARRGLQRGHAVGHYTGRRCGARDCCGTMAAAPD